MKRLSLLVPLLLLVPMLVVGALVAPLGLDGTSRSVAADDSIWPEDDWPWLEDDWPWLNDDWPWLPQTGL